MVFRSNEFLFRGNEDIPNTLHSLLSSDSSWIWRGRRLYIDTIWFPENPKIWKDVLEFLRLGKNDSTKKVQFGFSSTLYWKSTTYSSSELFVPWLKREASDTAMFVL
jgi:hypothetical protein